MFDESLCYGYGEYTISEVLCRLHYAYGVKPWDNSFKCFDEIDGFLDSFLQAPLIMLEEHKLYWKDYNPALLRKPQRKARSEFRLNFLQVYGKDFHLDRPNYSFTFVGKNSTKNSVWAFCFDKESEIPDVEEKKSSTMSEIDRESILVNNCTKETWYRYRGRLITANNIGVGPHDWHMDSLAMLYPINQEEEEEDLKVTGKRSEPETPIHDPPPKKSKKQQKKEKFWKERKERIKHFRGKGSEIMRRLKDDYRFGRKYAIAIG